jgi:hypothetical protein
MLIGSQMDLAKFILQKTFQNAILSWPPFSLGTRGHCPKVISLSAGDFGEIICIFMVLEGLQFILSLFRVQYQNIHLI